MFTGSGWPMWQVWSLYLFMGIISLSLIYYPLRNLSKWFLLIVISTIAALMFAPLPIGDGSQFWAPAALIVVIDFKQQHQIGLIHALFPILTLWVALMALGATWLLKKNKTSSKIEPKDD